MALRKAAAAAAAPAAKRARPCAAAAAAAAPGGGAPRATHAARWQRRARGGADGDATGRPVVYWMSRDARVADNWALVHAAEEAAARNAPLAVAYTYVGPIIGGQPRHLRFMLKGLRAVEKTLGADGVPFFMLKGADPEATLAPMLRDAGAGLLVTDMCPLREVRGWQDRVTAAVGGAVEVHQVDAHNVVPVWQASDKEEFAARTIRPRINRQLHEFLVEIPPYTQVCDLARLPSWPAGAPAPPAVDWDDLLDGASACGSVKEVSWCEPGEAAARAALDDFLRPERLKLYATKRNDPNTPRALSGLSPWLRFGHLSAQRAALDAGKHRGRFKDAVDSFHEELIIRRELADNFVWYQPRYDSVEGAKDWAKTSIDEHRGDARAHLYTLEQLEGRKTHDKLWNAAQREMAVSGKMHGYMRMYWAKKILEWTESTEQALEFGIALNDKYSLDGRCPNGFVGVAWSVMGIHDRAWGPVRPVFGKVRYMNDAGCKRKFDVPGYIARCESLKG